MDLISKHEHHLYFSFIRINRLNSSSCCSITEGFTGSFPGSKKKSWILWPAFRFSAFLLLSTMLWRFSQQWFEAVSCHEPCFPSLSQNMPSMSPEKPALCAGCGGKISDRYYLLAVDKQWHLRCLKCCECKLALESELTCFAKDGSIYCKEDYYR